MLRSVLVALCRLLLRIFFRRIEVVGAEQIPQTGPLVFVLNHPSGLIDPLFILCLQDRPVSFLAKAPLFDMPLIGWFVRAFGCLPVYRSQDGADPRKNRLMMQKAAALLNGGHALALFPEGTTHSDPRPRPFRSGAARIALSAQALGEGQVRVVPAALFYEQKQVFRSRAVIAFGPPLDVPQVDLNDAWEAPAPDVRALTGRSQEAVLALLPSADSIETLLVAERAERVVAAAHRDIQNAQSPSLATRVTTRRQLLRAYEHWVGTKDEHASRLVAIVERLQALGDELGQVGLPIDAPLQTRTKWHEKSAALRLKLLTIAPFAGFGVLLHFAPYRIIRSLAFRYSAHEVDVMATTKLVAGCVLFPITWAGAATAAGAFWGWGAALATLVVAPVCGWCTLIFQEAFAALERRRRQRRLVASSTLDWTAVGRERAALARDITELLEELGETSRPPSRQKTASPAP